MNDLRELRSLRRHFTDRPELTGVWPEYFRSDEYQTRCDVLCKDPRALARLTIALLKHIALDPQQGERVEDFLAEPAEGPYIVNLHFYRIVNMVGSFELPADAPEVSELKAGIAENLASRKFKAAKMHRRLEARNMKRFHRIARRAREAFQAYYDAEHAKAPPTSHYQRRREFEKQLRERADEVYKSVYQPLYDRLTGRLRAVGEQAYDPEYRGAYTDVLIKFAKTYVAPDVE